MHRVSFSVIPRGLNDVTGASGQSPQTSKELLTSTPVVHTQFNFWSKEPVTPVTTVIPMDLTRYGPVTDPLRTRYPHLKTHKTCGKLT